MAAKPSKAWQHPWIRIERMLRTILYRPWSAAQWRQLEPEIPKLLAEQDRIRRAGAPEQLAAG